MINRFSSTIMVAGRNKYINYLRPVLEKNNNFMITLFEYENILFNS